MRLIPHIPFIIVHAVALQKQTEFLLKRHRAVVVRLPLNVSAYPRHLGFADGKRAIAALPMKCRKRTVLSHFDEPFLTSSMTLLRAWFFDSANKVCICSTSPPITMAGLAHSCRMPA